MLYFYIIKQQLKTKKMFAINPYKQITDKRVRAILTTLNGENRTTRWFADVQDLNLDLQGESYKNIEIVREKQVGVKSIEMFGKTFTSVIFG